MDPSRNRWRWSLRFQLLILTGACVIAWNSGIVIRRTYLEAEFSRLGCVRLYRSQRPISFSPSPEFGIRSEGSNLDDEKLRLAMDVTHSLGVSHDTVVVTDGKLSDEGIRTLCRWNNINALILIDTPISGDAAEKLRRLPHLEHLYLNGVVLSLKER